jgi:hypothetical protein
MIGLATAPSLFTETIKSTENNRAGSDVALQRHRRFSSNASGFVLVTSTVERSRGILASAGRVTDGYHFPTVNGEEAETRTFS